jgi:hypothetical protein
VRRAQRLGTVLDDRDAVSALDVPEATQVETAAIEVDRHHEADLVVVLKRACREV